LKTPNNVKMRMLQDGKTRQLAFIAGFPSKITKLDFLGGNTLNGTRVVYTWSTSRA